MIFKRQLPFMVILFSAAFLPTPMLYARDALQMSLETAVLLALSNNPDINVATALKEQATFAVDEARSGYYPQVNTTLGAGREYNNPASFSVPQDDPRRGHIDNSYEFNVSMTQTIYNGGQTVEEVRRRKQLSHSSDIQTEMTYEQIILDTSEAYMNIYRLQNAVDEAEIFYKRMKGIQEKINLMVQAGAENQSKSKYVESRVSFAESERNNAAASLADALVELEYITGPIPPFNAKLPDVEDLLSIDLPVFVDMAKKNNTQILLNESDHAALKHELSKTEGKYRPTLSFLADYTKTNDAGGEIGADDTARAMLQMNYAVFDGFARDATKNGVGSQIKEIDARKQKLERDLEQKVKTSYNQISALEEEYLIVMKEIKSNEDLQSLYREQFELGEGDIINLVEGEERLYASKFKKHQIDADMLVSALKLIWNIGLLDKSRFCMDC